MGPKQITLLQYPLHLTTLSLIICALLAGPCLAEEEVKSDVYFMATYEKKINIGIEEKDKLVKENINITLEFYSEIPRHYYLPMNSFHYTTVINLSGLNATLVGKPQPVLGVRSNGLMVDGVDNSMVIHRSVTQIHECFYDLTYCREGITIGFWINFPKRPSGHTTVMSSGGEDGNHGFSMTTDQTGQMIFVFKVKGGKEWKLVTDPNETPIMVNKWYHFLITWSQQHEMVFYINGQPVKGELSVHRIHTLPLKEPREFWVGRPNDPHHVRSHPTSILIDEIHFWMDYKTHQQIQELGPVLFYRLPIGNIQTILSSTQNPSNHIASPHHPSPGQGVIVGGRPRFVKEGKSDHALEFNGRNDYVSEDISNFCFHNSSSCFNGFLLSTWIKFSDVGRDGVVISTGDHGFDISLRNGTLLGEVFLEGGKKWSVSWDKTQQGQWYYMELSMDPSEGINLFINQQDVAVARYKRKRQDPPSHGRPNSYPKIYVGKSSKGEFGHTAFTIDEFEIWYGDRNMLQNIGYIMRGRPVFYHFPMDEIDNQNRLPHHNLTVNVVNNPRLLAGKVKNALDLDGVGQYIAIPPNQRGQPPCFGNLNFCKHGATLSMWLKPHDLSDGRHFLSTGSYGFNMWQEDGLTKVTARVKDTEWLLVTDKLVTDKWQFVEITYDPSSHAKLQFYLDGALVKQSDAQGVKKRPLESRQFDGFYFARGDGTKAYSKYGQFTIDEVEYWLASRNYLTKFNFIQRGQLSDYIHIDMDKIKDDKMVHKTLKNIKVINKPHLSVGKVNNALTLNGKGQYLDLGKHRGICFGNLALCQEGVTNSMWVKFISLEDYAYLLSSGKGLQIYSLNKQLVFLVDVKARKWEVSIPGLKLNKWYFVEYTWHPNNGLQVYINNRLVGTTTNYVTSSRKLFDQLSSFKIGSANQGEPGRGKTAQTANAVVDEFEFWYNSRDALIASGSIIRDAITYILFPFERQQGTTVAHPDFSIYLHNGARITKNGRIGNGLLLAGREEFVTFGDQSRSCMGNLLLCPKGLTISMHLKPNSVEGKASILSAAPYHIYTNNGRLEAEFTNTTHVWRVTLERDLWANQWQQLDFSWDPIKGLEVYQEDRLVGSDHRPQTHQSYFTDHTVYLGRPTTDHQHKGFQYSNTQVDELQYWYASRDLVDTDPVINKVVLDMDVVSDTRLINPYTTILADGEPSNVPAINATGVKLNGHYQHLHSKGSQLVCHGNLENCQRGFTFRLKLKPDRLQDQEYVVSSAPLDVFILHKRVNAVLKTPDMVWKLASKPLQTGQWYQIDVSWCPEEGAVMYVNAEEVATSEGKPNPGNSQWSFDPSKDFQIGRSSSEFQRGDHLSGVLDDLQMWHARRDILLHHSFISRESFSRRNNTGVKFPPTYNLTNYRIFFDGHNWIYYDLSMLPGIYHTPSQREQFSLKFKTRHPDGLMYFNGDDGNNVQISLKEGYLYLVTVVNGQKERYKIGRETLNDDRWHDLFIERNGKTISVTLDGKKRQSIQLHHLITLLSPHNTYLGGTNHNRHLIYYINENFRGEFKDIWIWGNQYPYKIYLGKLPFVHPLPPYVNITGRWRYEKDDRIALVTPSIIKIIIDENKGKEPKDTVPVTFTTGRSRVLIDKWKPTQPPSSFELKYRTLEPNGILVNFKTDHSENDAVIELYDGKPFLVANFGRGHVRLPFGDGPQATNDLRDHFLRVDTSRDSLKLTLDHQTYSHEYMRGHNRSLDLSNNVYIGGPYNHDAVPWHVWSAEGFKGCVWNVRLNREADIDLWRAVNAQRVRGVEEKCSQSREDCRRQPCRNGGQCVAAWDSHACDCAATSFHGPSCEHHSRFASFGGQDKLVYTRNRPVETHTNDISLRFRTLKENALLFAVSNQQNNDIIRVDLERGVGKVETRFKGQNRPTYTTFECDKALNDNQWHTVHIKRRANYLEAYVDNCHPATTILPEENFKFGWDKVILGTDQRSPFVGHLQNFILNKQDYLSFIDQNNNKNLHIFTTVKTSDKESPIILSPVTFHRNSNAHLALPPFQISGASKVQLMFKTPEGDALLLYNPGIHNDFFAVEISQGRLIVRGDDSTGIKEVVGGMVNDSRWHSVEVEQRSPQNFEVILDGQDRETLKFEESSHTMDLTDRLYIGYVPDELKDRLRHQTRSTKGFAGCMASLVVNRVWYNLENYRRGDSHITSGCTELTEKVKYCVQGICRNEAHCEEVVNGFRCDCSFTAYGGERCDQEAEGLRFGDKKEKGIVIYHIKPPVTTDYDRVAFGFQTWEDSGTLVRLDSHDKQDFTEFKLVNGKLVTTYKVGGVKGVTKEMKGLTQKYNDGVFHRVLYFRNGDNATVRVDGIAQDQAFGHGNQLVESNRFNHLSTIKLGADLDDHNNIINHYDGILSGVNINGIRVINEKHIKRNDVILATHPFNLGRIQIKVTIRPIDITRPTLPIGVPTAITPFASTKNLDQGGGMGWGDGELIGDGEPRAAMMVGGGAVPGIGGVGASAAGAMGAMIGLLLLASSAMWALFKFKPGLLPGWGSAKAGAARGDPLLAKNFSSTGATPNLQGYEISGDQRVLELNQEHLQAPQNVTYSYERSQTFSQQGEQGAGMMGMLTLPYNNNVAMHNVDLSYGGFNQQDIFTQQQQQRMMQQQQQLMSATESSTIGRNFMAAEEIRVDCVQMTNNGRYVVTGSNCGPPQVWDLKSGELVRVMRGDQFSSTDLHLANGDTLLVGQVAELEPIDASDVNASNRIHQRKMQLWDFETGKPHEMHRIEMCTASSMMNDGERIVLGRTDKYGGGTTIVVYDLLSKEPVRSFKCDSSFGFADHISYLSVSKDNRYIIAGFQNSYDSTANYATFDLASNDSSGLKVASLDAPVEVTAVLNDTEAVTGTRKGELVVWSLKTGQLLRTLGGGGLLHAGSNDHHGDVKDLAVSRDGQVLVSASSDGSLKVWDLETEQLLHTLIGHKDEVWCCCLSPDNELVGSGSKDGTIRMWKVSDGSPVAAIDAGMTIFKVLLSNNKKTVVALGDKGGARKLIMLKVVRSTATIDRRAV